MPFGLDNHIKEITTFFDSCGEKLHEIQTDLENIEQEKISVQMMVATRKGNSKAVAEQLLASLEADHLAQTKCLEYALKTDDRFFGQLKSTCERLLAQLTRIASDPKSIDAIMQGDRVNPAEQPQQQAQASELEQLNRRVQDQTTENEGLRA